MTMPLYHISNKRYEKGEIVHVDNFTGDFTEYYLNHRDEANSPDDFLDDGRPEGYPMRKKAIFAFDNPSFCFLFNQQIDFCYEIEMEHPIHCPFHLSAIVMDEQYSRQIRENIRKEYWEPTFDWKVYEYIDVQMRITNLVSKGGGITCSKALNIYMQDYDRAKILFRY